MARVHVVMLTWNREPDTAEALDAFLAQRGAEVELLLVDNASPDGSGDRLHARYPHVGYLQTGSNLGYAGGNNRGMERVLAAGAEWVLVVNNDTVADPDCVRMLLDALVEDPGLGAVSPYTTQHGEGDRPWFAAGRLSLVRAMGMHVPGPASGPPTPCTFLSGCCVLFRARALREVGLFREDFWAYMEDVELSLRLTRARWRMAVVPGARLSHKAPPVDTEPTPLQIRLRDRNRRRLVRSHYPLPMRAAFWLWFLPTRVIHLARYAIRADGNRARAILAGIVDR